MAHRLSSPRLPLVENSPRNVLDFRYMPSRPDSGRSRSERIRFRIDSATSKSTVGGAQHPMVVLNPFSTFKVDDLTNYSMNDQRWTLQRKKIGLKRLTKGTRERRVRDIKSRDINLTFVRTHFHRKECIRFCRDPNHNGKAICFCGLPETDHLSRERLLNPVSRPHTQGSSRFLTVPEEEEDEEIVLGRDVSTLTSSIMGILGINGAPWGFPQGGVRPQGDEKSENGDVETGTDPRLPDAFASATGITPRAHARVHPMDPSPRSSISYTEPTVIIPPPTAKWTSSTHLQELPTNAYGTIDFINETAGTNKPAKYVRLSDTTDMKSVLTLLTDYWRMMEPERPQLVISVTGGAQFLKLEGKKKEIFTTGLMKAVKSTGAWILTGGLHVGVNRIVGEAVNENQFMVKVKRKELFSDEHDHIVRGIRCLGVLPWGFTKDKHLLLNTDLNQFSQVRYKVQERTNFDEAPSLDGDHTHFLMVDDGTRNFYNGTLNFRTRLEEAIQREEPAGLGIPVVLLLLEGGLGALGECALALKKNIPVVVVSGTGRAADLLAYAISMTIRTANGRYILRKQYVKQLMSKILAAMTDLEDNPEKQKRCADYVLECCSRANMIITFDIDCGEGLDHCLLYALLTGGAQSSRLEQLNLAVLWDRPDIAEHHIFPAETNWASWDLRDLMTTALLDDKVEFVKLFILNGLVMSDYLTVATLRQLYNEACKNESHTHLRRLLQRSSRSSYHHLIHVHNILQAMLRKHNDPVYMADTPEAIEMDSSINYLTFEDPYRELLLWAIFSRKGNLARFLWERCESPLVAAVVATCVYESLFKSLGAKNTVILNEYQKQKNRFETLAVELQDVCYQEDPTNAMSLIERQNQKWGKMDCLELAHIASDIMFIATPCSQASVELNWRRGMTVAPSFSVIIANFFPFLVWTKLFSFQKLGDSGGDLTGWQKLVVFYKSPISKFFAHSTSFFLFLLLYAYVILFSFRYEMTLEEKLMISWIFIFTIGEITEIASEQSGTLRGKISDWLSSVWNRFDLMAIALAFSALALRLNRSTFKWGRVAYSLNTTIFYCRLFRIYHVNYHLGPKLVIFYRMISEVLVFMALLVIFILGYGIASQGLLYPIRDAHALNMTDVAKLMKDVLLTPYWQMYGELLLDEVSGDDLQTCYQQTCRVPESCVSQSQNCVQDCVCENARDYSWAVSLMLFIYLIIGNIMLLNLLIAIFTYVFDEVQVNSMEIWKFEMYRLIREYDGKPGLVPPFVLLEYLWRIGKGIWKVCCRKRKENLEDYMQDTLAALKIFEKETITNYLAKVTAAEEDTLDMRVKRMSDKIDKVSKYIEQREEIEDMEDDFEWMTEDEEHKVDGSTVDHRPPPIPPPMPGQISHSFPASHAPQMPSSFPGAFAPERNLSAPSSKGPSSVSRAKPSKKKKKKASMARPKLDAKSKEAEDDDEELEDDDYLDLNEAVEDVEINKGADDEQEISAEDIEKELVQLHTQKASDRHQGALSRPQTSHRTRIGSSLNPRIEELVRKQDDMASILDMILKKITVSEARQKAWEEEERKRRSEKEREEEEKRRNEVEEKEENERIFMKSKTQMEEKEEEEEEEEGKMEEEAPPKVLRMKSISKKTKSRKSK